MPTRNAVSSGILGLFGDHDQMSVERAIAELRSGRSVILQHDGRQMVAVAAEFSNPDLLAALRAIASGPLMLVLTSARLRALGRPGFDGAMAIEGSRLDSDRVMALIARRDEGLREDLLAVDRSAESAVQLARLALLLPAVLIAPISAEVARTLPAITVDGDAIREFAERRSTEVTIVSRAPVPLLTARNAEFVVFRGGEGMREQVAVIVGNPDPAGPVLVRLHSACLTGDLFGSLRCDCGDQLRGSLASMAQAGGGVLLYLDQEGRGNGIANKIRAYGLQHEGLDTYEADETLGFDLDSRRFEFAAAMLRQLGFARIRLLTNNPEKAGAMRRAGIDVTDTQRVSGRRSPENASYLAAKRDRAGHLVDPDTHPEPLPNPLAPAAE